jgi:hypothetical protein
MTKHLLLLVFGLMVWVEGAAAQAPPSVTNPSQPIASAPPTELAANCAPTASAPLRGTVTTVPPDGTTTGQASEPLADKLAKSNGVLCPPPGVDPEIRAPTPDAGNTPVIPPPGSPGGNPNVQPK